ncbi:MAG: LD-carboxypeptidase [Cyanobacteria bacterium P01_H01_bin.15]
MNFNRRQLFTGGLGAIAVTLLNQTRASGQSRKPRRLKPGDRVGLCCPAGAVDSPEQVVIVEDAMRALGLVSVRGMHLLDRYGYLAGKDRDRAADVNQFFADPDIALILPITGGWGCARTLPYLDFELIRQNPKILVGFSDVTALLLGIQAQTGLVTFHGPNGFSSWRSRQTDWFKQVLFAGQQITWQQTPDPGDGDRLMQVANRIQTIYPGTATGTLIGGNLSVLSAIVGTPFFPDTQGRILFLEDIGENIYRLDRMLTQLKLAGILDDLNGFIFGQCQNCDPGSGFGSLTLMQVLEDHIKPLGIPAWLGAPIGHVENIATLPSGTTVAIDSQQGTITMTETAVV